MANECNVDIEERKFRGDVKDFLAPKFKEFKNILGANWTISINLYRPFGFTWKSYQDNWTTPRLLPIFQLRNRNAFAIISGNSLCPNILIKGKIIFRRNSLIIAEQTFENLFKDGDRSHWFEVESRAEDEIDFDCSIHGVLKFYVSLQNYFYFNYEIDQSSLKSGIEGAQIHGLNELSNDLRVLFQNQDLSDLSIRCEEEVFYVHKVFLSSRSPIFYAMFHNKMKENEENVVVIKDMRPKILEKMLEFIYCGKVSKIDYHIACDLLTAAEKYQLLGLKRICVTFLECSMCRDNVLSVLALADLYDENLKKKAIDFASLFFDILQDTAEWNEFQKENALLANEVLQNIIKFAHSRGVKIQQ